MVIQEKEEIHIDFIKVMNTPRVNRNDYTYAGITDATCNKKIQQFSYIPPSITETKPIKQTNTHVERSLKSLTQLQQPSSSCKKKYKYDSYCILSFVFI